MNKISMKNYLITITRVLLTGAAILLAAEGVSSANPRSLSGVVQTGGTSSSQPLPNVHVSLFEATTEQPTILGQATTDGSGRFSIRYTRSTSHSIFFVQADVSEGVEFVTVLGPSLPISVTINELTTVAASYSMAQFLRTGVISGNSFGLQIAAGMNDNIVAFATGQSSPVLLSSPNADQTNSLRSTRSLANLLAACVNDPTVTANLFDLTTPAGSSPPGNTAQALANLARDPGQNVVRIFALTLLSDLYDPPLVTMPDAWTVTVKVNDSGSAGPDRLISGPANSASARSRYPGVTNNTVQGTPCSGRFNLVSKPNGQPADGTNGTPRSPLTGGGVLGAGYGVTIDNHSVWFGNFGWGDSDHCSPTPIPSPSPGNGSVSRFTLTGMPVSPPDAYQGGPVRAQGMAADAGGNIWISSFGNNSVFVFKHGNPYQSVGFDQQVGGGPLDIAIAADGSAWVTNGLGSPPATIAKYALVNGELVQQFRHLLGDQLRGISLDSQGNAWVASQGDGFVYALGPDGAELCHSCQFNRGGIDGPWGITVDGEDNIWVGNFGPLRLRSNFMGRLTKLWGVNAPPGHNVGDPISPRTGYTVPSAGSEVLLHDGQPLYGLSGPPCFIPMMRSTDVNIDHAGNLWLINNWKPDFAIDTIGGNPGGDGIIIFVGLAAPPTTQVH